MKDFIRFRSIWASPRILWVLIFVALATRCAFVSLHPPENYIFSDMADYHNLATELVATGNEDISFAFQPPGTHFLIAAFYYLNMPQWSIGYFYALLSTAMCLFSYLTIRMVFGRNIALISLAILSVDFLYIKYTGYYLSETPFSFGIALMFYFLVKSIYVTSMAQKHLYAFLFGLTLIITAAFKSNILIILPLLGIWWLLYRKQYKVNWHPFFVALGLLPLTIFLIWRTNHLTGNQTLSISGNSGMNFYYGRAHLLYMGFLDENENLVEGWSTPVAHQRSDWHKKEYFTQHYTHNDFFMREGMKLALAAPQTSLKYSMGYLSDLFFTTVPWPTGNRFSHQITKAFNIFICLFLVIPGILFGLIYFRKMKGNPAFLIWLSAMSIFLIAFIFFGSPRFRIPYDQLFIPLAIYVYWSFFSRWKAFKATQTQSRQGQYGIADQ